MVGRADNIMQSLKEIAASRGIKGFYTGYKSTIARDIVFSAFQMPLFEFIRTNNDWGLSPIVNSSVSGSIAACIAGFVSTPLDVIKTRIMTEKMNISVTSNMIQRLYKEQGVSAFFRGASFRCGILAFGGIVYFGALQKARQTVGLS